jgi:hypothetical protein
VAWAPDATPFVSLYACGRLVGCAGSDEGPPRERLARAFVRALADRRAAALDEAGRAALSAQVSYPSAQRPLAARAAEEAIEVGSDGVALLGPAGEAAVLLPSVARDGALGPAQLLVLLARKAGRPLDRAGARLVALRAEEVAAGDGARFAGDARSLGADWLAARVGDSGQVDGAVDPHSGAALVDDAMPHGRAAVAAAALAACGRRAEAERALAWIGGQLAAALDGRAVRGWPEHPARQAGTLALAVLAGAPLGSRSSGSAPRAAASGLAAALTALARRAEVAAEPWHAAQVVCALGARAPASLWPACQAALERRPWAPWTVLAAAALSDGAARERGARALIDSLRSAPPHRGGCAATAVPELALTALTVEALRGAPGAGARAAMRRGREFLRRWQLLPGRIPAALARAACAGAFPASPVAALLRVDVTAHALLALA